MSYMFTAIVYKNGQFDEQAVGQAIQETEAKFPTPHPHLQESYVKVAVTANVSAIFYLVGGYRRSACYSRQRDFFQEDGFPYLVDKAMKASHASYRFFAHLYNDMFGDIITGKYTEHGFDERHSFEGGNEVHHFFTDEAGVTQSNYSVDPTSPVFHVDAYLADELGISQQDMIAAFHRIPEGAVLRKFTGNS